MSNESEVIAYYLMYSLYLFLVVKDRERPRKHQHTSLCSKYFQTSIMNTTNRMLLNILITYNFIEERYIHAHYFNSYCKLLLCVCNK